jgi:hypothetical protein
MKAVGGLGVLGGSISSLIAHAQASSPLIDTHHHFYPPEYHKAWIDAGKSAKNSPLCSARKWTLQNAIAAMDESWCSRKSDSLFGIHAGTWFDLPVPEG